MKNRLPFVIQALVSLVLLALVFRKPDFWVQLERAIWAAKPGWLFLAFLTAGVMTGLGMLRWGLCLSITGVRITPWEIARASWLGLFFNFFLIGAVGNDAVRIGWICSRGYPASRAVSSVIMDRICAFISLLVAAPILMLARLDWLSVDPIVGRITRFAFIYLGVLSLVIFLSFFMAKRRAMAEKPRSRLAQKLHQYSLVHLRFVEHWPISLVAVALSLLIVLGYFLVFYFAALAFGVDLPVLNFFAVMPMVDIGSSLPVSLGGFGVREQLFQYLYGRLCAVPAGQAVAISLCGATLCMVWGLPGALLLPGYRRRRDVATGAAA